MVRYITLTETFPTRSAALRNGAAFSECAIPEDNMENSFHLGYEMEGEIIGTASFFPVGLEKEEGQGFQLRLMGVIPQYQKKGIGKDILLEGIELLKARKDITYLWCNARMYAMPFYENMGMMCDSEEFDIPKIGPHKRMILHFEKV